MSLRSRRHGGGDFDRDRDLFLDVVYGRFLEPLELMIYLAGVCVVIYRQEKVFAGHSFYGGICSSTNFSFGDGWLLYQDVCQDFFNGWI